MYVLRGRRDLASQHSRVKREFPEILLPTVQRHQNYLSQCHPVGTSEWWLTMTLSMLKAGHSRSMLDRPDAWHAAHVLDQVAHST